MHTKQMKILAFILYSKGSQSLLRPWYTYVYQGGTAQCEQCR